MGGPCGVKSKSSCALLLCIPALCLLYPQPHSHTSAVHAHRPGRAEGKSKKKQLHRKYREEKLVRQHHKKVKKVARKCKAAGIKAPHKREPTLPNSAPHFKAEFLREAEQHKERVAGEREKR